jgi:hypothetical protein
MSVGMLLVAGCRPAVKQVDVNPGEMIAKLIETNRVWLLQPPAGVTNFEYVLNLSAGSRRFEVPDPAHASNAHRQAVTYYSILQHLARNPGSETIKRVEPWPGAIRLDVKFDAVVEGAVGNGVENSWTGYHTISGSEGYIVIDTNRWVPLEAGLGRLRERFSEYATVVSNQYAPLTVRLDIGETSYEWKFKVHEPGLWLYEEGTSGTRKLAWIDHVKVNGTLAKVVAAAASEREEDQAERKARGRLRRFLEANAHWLLPRLDSRAGLIYEYSQEAPYMERIIFHPHGHVLARLESSKESSTSTTERLWMADGRAYYGLTASPFLSFETASPDPLWTAAYWPYKDRLVQHLLMGLALECAATRLAREPDAFWVEVQDSGEHPDSYVLILKPKSAARLFTGTMLTFSSWCYIHDVAYDRAELMVNVATHRLMDEHTYSQGQLKASYEFQNWIEDGSSAAPGQIRAVLPHKEQGQDQSLEMIARFHYPRPGTWLLREVESRFRGTDSKSSGTITLVNSNSNAFALVDRAIEKAQFTADILYRITQTAEPGAIIDLQPGSSANLVTRALWTAPALDAARAQADVKTFEPLVGLYRATLSTNAPTLEVEGVTAAPFMEFASAWKFEFLDSQGSSIGSVTTNILVRSERGPSPFRILVPTPAAMPVGERLRVSARGTVQRMTAFSRGAGRWFHLSNSNN